MPPLIEDLDDLLSAPPARLTRRRTLPLTSGTTKARKRIHLSSSPAAAPASPLSFRGMDIDVQSALPSSASAFNHVPQPQEDLILINGSLEPGPELPLPSSHILESRASLMNNPNIPLADISASSGSLMEDVHTMLSHPNSSPVPFTFSPTLLNPHPERPITSTRTSGTNDPRVRA